MRSHPRIRPDSQRYPAPTRPPPKAYDRARDLPQLLPTWPADIADVSLGARSKLIERLQTALRSERRAGLAGAWWYNLARHHQLLIAYRAELSALKAASGPMTKAALPTSARHPLR